MFALLNVFLLFSLKKSLNYFFCLLQLQADLRLMKKHCSPCDAGVFFQVKHEIAHCSLCTERCICHEMRMFQGTSTLLS